MKKILNILLCGVLVVGLTACGNDKESLKDGKKDENIKTVVCSETSKDEDGEQTETTTFTFKDDKATKILASIAMKYNNLSKEEAEEFKNYDFTEEIKKLYESVEGLDVNKFNITQKRPSDKEVIVSIEADFEDYFKLINSDNEYDLNNDYSYNNVYEKIIKDIEKDEDITCKVN